jgi:formylglycine-generating enzyme required for sulfatase activity
MMSCTEVTQEQWYAVMGTSPSLFIGDGRPVEGISWIEAVTFCNRLSRIEGLDTCYTRSGAIVSCDFAKNGYRLPTEAEWEYACRGGTASDYYTGNMTLPVGLDPALERAGWCNSNSGGETHEVRSKEPNSFGLYDMHGNVWEWCWDWYGPYPDTGVTDYRGPDTGVSRVHRGGSWHQFSNQCRSAFREGLGSDCRSDYGGIRLVRMN